MRAGNAGAWPELAAVHHRDFFRFSPSAANSSPAPCRAASSRCWRSARGLASAPDLLMLDEPSMGLAPTIVDTVFDRIELHPPHHGLTILLVEQRVAEALELCDRGYVLETGHMVLDGSHDTLMSNAEVQRAYLGH